MKKIAFLGTTGSFSFIAAKKYFGNKLIMMGKSSIKNVFAQLHNHNADFGVVPIENSTTGSIFETYDELMKNKLQITGEIKLKIHHNLLTLAKNTSLAEIENCYSHPQGIIQCRNFLDENGLITAQPISDTATAAQMVSKLKNKKAAAIASAQTAKIYGLAILRKNIEDNKNNFTRFVVIGDKKNKSGDKVSVVFSVKHVPGSLLAALRPYAGFGLNLTKIESRPIFGKTWEYIFFADFELKNQEKELAATLAAMKKECLFLTVLGRYRKGKVYEA